LPAAADDDKAAGAQDAELAVWNLATGGACRRCFRAVKPVDGLHTSPLPTLDAVPLPSHPAMPIFSVKSQLSALNAAQAAAGVTGGGGGGGGGALPGSLGGIAGQANGSTGHSVRAIMGRISASGNSYVITGDTERQIR